MYNYFSKKKLLPIYQKYMTFVGIAGQSAIYIQLLTVLRNHASANVSLIANVCAFISLVSWFIYGLLIKDKPLIIGNIVACIGSALLIIAIITYS